MDEMIEKRELQISHKIFTKNDLMALLQIFRNQAEEILEKSKEIRRLELIQKGWSDSGINDGYIDTSHSEIIYTSDINSKYTFSIAEIDNAIRVLDNKKISELELLFTEKVSGSRFIVKLRQTDTLSGTSYALIESQDNDWVNTTMSLIMGILQNTENQSVFVRKYKILIIAGTTALLTWFLLNLIRFFIKTEVSFPKIVGNIFNDDLLYYIALFVLVTVTPAVLIYRWFRKLYPVIEIHTGTRSGVYKKEKRNKVIMMVLLIVIPVIISMLIK